MIGPEEETDQRLSSLEEHLRHENPLLVDAVKGFRRLDKIAYRMGLLSSDQTYAAQIAWWPLVSVGCRPTALVCPRCWPSYLCHAVQFRGSRRHAMPIVRLTPVDPSIYICHQCHSNGSETCH